MIPMYEVQRSLQQLAQNFRKRSSLCNNSETTGEFPVKRLGIVK